MSSSKALLLGVMTAFLVSFVVAQGTPTGTALASASSAALVLPPCAVSCFETAIMEDGCALTDLSCHCSKASELAGDLGPCVTDQCSLADGYAFSNAFEEICSKFGSSSVPLVVATSGSPPVVSTTVASVSVSSMPSTPPSPTPTMASISSAIQPADSSSATSALVMPMMSTLLTSTIAIAISTTADADQKTSSITPIESPFSTSSAALGLPVSPSTFVSISTVTGTSVVPTTQVVLIPYTTASSSAPVAAVNNTGNANGTSTPPPIIYSSAAESGVVGYATGVFIMLQTLYGFVFMLL